MATEAEREGGGKRETSSENIGITKINMNISGARRWLNHRPHVACPRADVACPRADVACPRAALDSAVRERVRKTETWWRGAGAGRRR